MGMYNTSGQYDGRAAVYHLENGVWVQKVDIQSTNTGKTRFGDAVLMNKAGTRIALAFYDNNTIEIYEYSSGSWPTSPTKTIYGTSTDYAGNGDIDWDENGTVIVAGRGEGGGKSWIYRRNSSTGDWTEEHEFVGFTSLGNGVAMNSAGTRILTGVRNSSGSHPNFVGKVYESNYDGNSWGSLTEVYASSASTNNWPTRIRMDDDGTTAVIMSGTDGQGRILERQSGTSWTSVMDVKGRCSFYSRGSSSISHDGMMVLTGDNYYTPSGGVRQGRAFMYEYSGGSWSLTKTYENPKTTPAADDGWGYGTAIAKNSKDRFAIGMSGDGTYGSEYGSVYVYTNAIPDYISFDTYNKLSLSGLTNPKSKIHALPTGADSTTYDIGTATNVYIDSAGKYTAEMKGSDGFAIDSNVVGTITPLPTTDLDIPGFPTNSAPSRTNIAYTNSIGQTLYTGGKYSLTYNGDAYEITVDSEEQGGSTYNPTTSVWARGWHLFTKILTSEDVGGGTTTDFAQYNSANYVTVPAHVKIKLPSAKVAVGGFLRESRNNHISGFIIQCSNNDSDWTDLYTGTTIGKTTGVTFTFSNSTAYQYYRLRITSLSSSGNNYFRLDAMNIHFLGYVAAPSLTFDGFNKYTFTDADTGSTYKLKYLLNTYDLGTTSTAYIKDAGTYSAEIKGATNFALSSNVTGTVSEPTISGPVTIEWASLGGDYSNFDGNGGRATGSGSGVLSLTDTWATPITSPFNGIAINLTGASSGDHNFRYTIPFKPKTQSFELSFKVSQPSSGTVFQAYMGYLTLNWTAAQGWNSSGDSRQKVVNLYAPGSTIYLAGMTGQSLDQSSYTHDSTKPFVITSNTSTLKIEHNGNSKSIDLTATHEDSSGGTVADPEYYFWMAFDESSAALFSLSDITYSVGGEVIKSFPTLSFDGYNKLSFSNIAPTTSNVTFDENTYSIGSATNIYIENTGTYEAESKSASTFALMSNVVDTVSSKPPILPILKFENLGTSLASNVSGVNLVSESTYTTPTYDSINNAIQTAASSSLLCDFSSVRTSTSSDLAVVFEAYYDHNEGLTAVVALGEYTSNPNTDFSIDQRSNMGTSIGGLVMHGTAYLRDTSIGGTYAWANTGLNAIDYKDKWTKHALVHYNKNAWWYIYVNGEWKLHITTSPIQITGTHSPDLRNFMTNGFPSKIRVFRYPGQYGTGTYSTGTKVRNIEIYDDVSFIVSPSADPSLTFDGYKLVVKNITPTSSTLKYLSNTYDIGSATNVYIKDVGTYTAEIGGATDFAFTSNVSSGTIKTIEPVITGASRAGHALTYDGKLYAWGKQGEGEAGTSPDSPEDWSDVSKPTLAVKNPYSSGTFQGEIVSIWNQSKVGQSRWAKTRDGRIWLTGDRNSYCTPFDWDVAPAGSASSGSGDLKNFTDVSLYFGDHTQTSNSVVWASGSQRATQVLMENGDVWSYGDNSGSTGVLGQGTNNSYHTPTKLNISNVTKIVYNNDLVLALDSSGNVWMWGRNVVGNSTAGWGPYNVPTNIMGTGTANLTGLLVSGETVTDIECGGYSMFVITSKGTVYATGNNGSGQLGQGGTTAKTSSDGWVKIDYFTTKSITVNKLYTGGEDPHVFADTSDGWYCWGENSNGELGLGDTTDKSTPIKFTHVSNIKVFGLGDQGSYAITEDGKYYAWGKGGNYARGDNDTGNITYPKYIDTLPNILAPSFEFDGYDKVFANPFVGLITNIGLNKKIDSVSGYHGQYTHGSITNSEITNDMNFTTTILTNGYPTDFSVLGQNIVRPDQTLQNGQWHSNNQSDPWFRINLEKDSYVDNCVLHRTSLTSTRYQNVRFQLLDSSETQIKEVNVGDFGSTVTFKTAFCHASGVRYVKVVTGSSSYTHYDEIRINGYVLADSIVKYTKGTTTYDAGKASIVTVSDPGTYDAQLTQGGTFSLKSATVPATSSTGLYTWAFHHGNFDNAYGDGDILTARDNGRFYADTPAYTGDIGTISNKLVVSDTQNFASTITPTGTGDWVGLYTWGLDTSQNTSTARFYELSTGSVKDGFEIRFENDSTVLYCDSSNNEWDPGWVSTSSSTTPAKSKTLILGETVDLYRNYNPASTKVGSFTVTSGHLFSLATSNKSLTTYTFTPPSGGLTANVLMVAGGGGGGRVQHGGGGGAGGLVYTAGTTLSGAKTIVVGNGGLIGGDSGNDTTFTNLTTVVKGGYGGDGNGQIEPQDGGSGGGQAWNTSTTSSGTLGQGYGGGGKSPATSDESGGGGGGAGEAGYDGWIIGSGLNDARGGNGGKGKFFGTGSSDTNFGDEYGEDGWFAGGGGGGAIRTSWSGLPGKGGGGRGYGVLEYKPNDDLEGVKGFHHTGGGGGGGGWSGKEGGGGGSGIVLIQTNVPTPRVNTNVGVSNDYYVHAMIEDSQTHMSYRRGAGGNGHSTGGYHDNIRKPDGSLGRVYRATGYGYIHIAGADSLVSTVEGIFYPIEQKRYDSILEIGHNSSHDVELEMAEDGTAKLYRNQGGTHLASGTVKCFTAGKWHHVVLTLDANRNAVAYVNGYPVVSTTYSSAILPGSRSQNCIYRTGVGASFRKFMFYYYKTYNSVLNQNQILKLASSVGLGPKLEYDGLNTLKILNTEPGSTVRLFTSNVADTSNVFIVADPAAGEYTIPESGKYYAEIKGTDTFTITKTLDVSGTFPLYQYPPYDGTTSSLTQSASADTWSMWSISGAVHGNGHYQAKTTHSTDGTTYCAYRAFNNDIEDGNGQLVSTTKTNFGLTLQLPSAKTIRKYRMYPVDHNLSGAQPPGSSTDPTLPGNSSEDAKARPNSWVLKGSNDGTNWTDLDTVTDKPISIYGDVYSIDSPVSYQYYQMFILNVVDDSQTRLRLGEWQLWGDA
jgi:alpha-tubulin suppressor-like RCC1 family protein